MFNDILVPYWDYASLDAQRPNASAGLFVTNFPRMTVMGFLMIHLVYVLVGALYEAWA